MERIDKGLVSEKLCASMSAYLLQCDKKVLLVEFGMREPSTKEIGENHGQQVRVSINFALVIQ